MNNPEIEVSNLLPVVPKTSARDCSNRSRRTAFVVVTAALVACVAIGTALIHGFLAVEQPNGKGVLVVEAWIPPQALHQAVQVFDSHSYQYVVVVGGPMGASGGSAANAQTYADRAFNELAQFGFDMSKVVKLPVQYEEKRRTYASAKAVRGWLSTSHPSVHDVDVYTLGVHARKSWILFEHALGKDYRVGIIAGQETSYNPARWLLALRGRRVVARNLVGYLYTKLWVSLDAMRDELYRQYQSEGKGHDGCPRISVWNADSWVA